jgi:hypothetical protein
METFGCRSLCHCPTCCTHPAKRQTRRFFASICYSAIKTSDGWWRTALAEAMAVEMAELSHSGATLPAG